MPEFIHDDQSIHYEIKGTLDFTLKTPILLLHGNGEDMHTFDSIVNPLLNAKGFVLMDSRLQGESYPIEGGSQTLSYESMASDALALMDYLGIREYDIMGYSDGGIVALLMAMKSVFVRRIIAIGVNINPGGLTSKALREMRRIRKKAFSEGDLKTAELMRLMLEEPNISLSSLAGICCETTIVAGRRDDMIDKKHSVQIADAIPRASHVFVDNAGHDVPFTHPGMLCDMIRTML